MIQQVNIRKEVLNNGIIKRTFDLYDTGSCQCYGDCGCYLSRGVVERDVVTYNNLPTLEEAIAVELNRQQNKQRHLDNIAKMLEWKANTPKKEVFATITKFKQINSNLKRFNHHEIYDSNKLLDIYFWSLK